MILRAVLLASALLPTVVLAAEAPRDDASHPVASPDIVITASLERDRETFLSGVTVLQGTELTRQIRGTIGETLSRQPGVSSTAFGPNASRPVLRGFQGERIRVLSDGIGSFDVSNTSVDHAVVVNPLLAERIDVLHGPQSLIYGSSAVGGVVNVIDKRIPRAVPEEAVHIDAVGTYGSAANERSGALVVEVPLLDRIVLHVDGDYAKSGNLDIGGFVLSKPVRAQALASGDPVAQDVAALRGTLPNSAARTYTYAGGVAFIDAKGELGIAVSRYDSLYGVPARFDPATGDGEMVRLDLKQDRVDARGLINIDSPVFSKLSARFGYADYQHREIDDEGNVGTTFLNKSSETRVELTQADRGGWKGSTGVQFLVRDFNIIGDEAFVPKNQTEQLGVFTLQQFDLGALNIVASARYEHTSLESTVGDFRGSPFQYDRSFDAWSGSAGASTAITDGLRIGASAAYTQRAPAAEEVLANGPHAGTQSFEIGDTGFDKEKGYSAEAVLRGRGENYSFDASVYYNRFSNYIYEDQTGAVEDDLPVFQFRQAKARYYGAEANATATVARSGDTALNLDALADYTNARLLNGLGPVPRIPPFRTLAGVGVANPRFDARVEAEYSAKQTRTAAFETRTGSYTLVNASASFRPFAASPGTSVLVSANNVFDVDARRHASFLKDFAPLAGRDFRITLRVVL